MKEGIDPKLREKYNRKLREAGMPARLKPTKIPLLKEVPDTETLARQATEDMAIEQYNLMGEGDSDKNAPKPKKEALSESEEEQFIEDRVANYIKGAKETMRRDKTQPKGEDKFKH